MTKKKRKTNSGGAIEATTVAAAPAAVLSFTSPSNRSSAASSSSSSLLGADDDAVTCMDECGDVMGTPAALAPSTLLPAKLRLAFTPSLSRSSDPMASPSAADGSDNTTRRLGFSVKECATPGRYDARHKLAEPMAVYCRIKPISEFELEVDRNEAREAGATWTPTMVVESDTSLVCTAPASSRHSDSTSRFAFTRTFGPEASQTEVYTHTTRPLVDSFYAGQNGLIFAYGITASGKTYTMQGTRDEPGLIPRIVLDLFNMVSSERASEPPPAWSGGKYAAAWPLKAGESFSVTASYLEVYNESINDLLAEPTKPNINGTWPGASGAASSATAAGGAKKATRGAAAAKEKAAAAAAAASSSSSASGACRLQQSGNDSEEMSVVNLREVEVRTHKDALALIAQGQSNRIIAETSLNADSSRSHSVFTLKLLTPSGAVHAKLSVVDLAGSERTNRVAHSATTSSSVAGTKDSRTRETANINTSLLVLGRCLEALRHNQTASAKRQRVVPFRESAITRLFKDSLSGWGKTVMLTAASQRASDYDETIHALKYAAVASEVKLMTHRGEQRRAAAATQAARAKQKELQEQLAKQQQMLLAQQQRSSTASNGTNSGASSARPSAGLKRAASQALVDLDEVEHRSSSAAAAGSSWDADEGNPSYDALLHECFLLRQRGVDLELQVARIEEDTRLELTAQHEQALQEMEEQCEKRVEQAYARAEEKAKKMLAIWQKEQLALRAAEGKENAAQAPVMTAAAPLGKHVRAATRA